jgi:hypothetical protein
MPGIYNTLGAGLNAYQLFEELSEIYSVNGIVELHKTMASEATKNGQEKYPPIYKVWLIPNRWESISIEMIERLMKIAEKHDVKMKLTARSASTFKTAHLVVEFSHR